MLCVLFFSLSVTKESFLMAACSEVWKLARREVKPCVVSAFHFIIRYFQSALFLREMSLSFVEDGLSSASPRGRCLLVGPAQGQGRATTVEKNKCSQSTNTLITWAHAHMDVMR